jgi:hypothetical protein
MSKEVRIVAIDVNTLLDSGPSPKRVQPTTRCASDMGLFGVDVEFWKDHRVDLFRECLGFDLTTFLTLQIAQNLILEG